MQGPLAMPQQRLQQHRQQQQQRGAHVGLSATAFGAAPRRTSTQLDRAPRRTLVRIAQPLSSPVGGAVDSALRILREGVAAAGGGGGSSGSSGTATVSAAAAAAASAAPSPVAVATAVATVAATAAPAKAKAASDLAPRVAAGVLLGAAGAGVVGAGGGLYLAATLFVTWAASQEYFSMVSRRARARGDDLPPPAVAAGTTLLCLGLAPAAALSSGGGGAALSVAAFLLLALHVVAGRRPTFSQLTSGVFGLFYCGFLPSFWLKLRALGGSVAAAPAGGGGALAGLGLPPLSLGLVVTLATIICIVAAGALPGLLFPPTPASFGMPECCTITPPTRPLSPAH